MLFCEKLISVTDLEQLKYLLRQRPVLKENQINATIPAWLSVFDLLSERYVALQNPGAAQMVQEDKFFELCQFHQYGILFKEQFKYSLDQGLPTIHSSELNHDFLHALLLAQNLKQGQLVLGDKKVAHFSPSIQYNFFIQSMTYVHRNQLDYALFIKKLINPPELDLQTNYFHYLDGLLEIYFRNQNVPDPIKALTELTSLMLQTIQAFQKGQVIDFYDLPAAAYSFFYLLMSHTLISATMIVGENYQIEKFYEDDQLMPLVLLFKDFSQNNDESITNYFEFMKKTLQEWTTNYLLRYKNFVSDALEKLKHHQQKLPLYNAELMQKLSLFEKQQTLEHKDIEHLNMLISNSFETFGKLLKIIDHPFLKPYLKEMDEIVFELEVLMMQIKKVGALHHNLKEHIKQQASQLKQTDFLTHQIKAFKELFFS